MAKDIRRVHEHSPQSWARVREPFTFLYRDQKRPLCEVQRIMQKEWGFDATARQYKRKIKYWGLQKNSNAIEKNQVLLTLGKIGEKLEMNCIYTLQGRDVAAHKLQRFARTHGLEVQRNEKSSEKNRKTLPANVYDLSYSHHLLLMNSLEEFKQSYFRLQRKALVLEHWNYKAIVATLDSDQTKVTENFERMMKAWWCTQDRVENLILHANRYLFRNRGIEQTVFYPSDGKDKRSRTSTTLRESALSRAAYDGRVKTEVFHEDQELRIDLCSLHQISLLVFSLDKEISRRLESFYALLRDLMMCDSQNNGSPTPSHLYPSSSSNYLPDPLAHSSILPSVYETARPTMVPPAARNYLGTGTLTNYCLKEGKRDLPDYAIDGFMAMRMSNSAALQDPMLLSNTSRGIVNSDTIEVDSMEPVSKRNLNEFSFGTSTMPCKGLLEPPKLLHTPGDALVERRALREEDSCSDATVDLEAFLDPSLWEDGGDSRPSGIGRSLFGLG